MIQIAEQKQVWTYQDNYGQWRWQAFDGEAQLASQRGYASREEAVASHELQGLTQENGYLVMSDGVTQGAAKVPLPRIDAAAEAAASGARPPARPTESGVDEGPIDGPEFPGQVVEGADPTPMGVRPHMVEA